jgi:hypothetical protein
MYFPYFDALFLITCNYFYKIEDLVKKYMYVCGGKEENDKNTRLYEVGDRCAFSNKHKKSQYMNIAKINNYITQYRQDFEKVRDQEIYKWKAVKCFQDNWDIDNPDFAIMLDKSLDLAKNLLDSGQYFPKRMLIGNATKNPNEIKGLFVDLFDEEHDLKDRIEEFERKFSDINAKNFPNKKDYQDHRAILVYLSLKFPERYYLYKFSMFKEFAAKIDYDYLPIKGRIENIGQYQVLCELIKHELVNDQEVLKLHKNKLSEDCYFDEGFKILTQDFIYAVVHYLEIDKSAIVKKFKVNKVSFNTGITNIKSEISFKGRITNYLDNERENKRIGDLGEKWVIQKERETLKSIGLGNLADLVRHVAVEDGDGTGFDIESFDNNKAKIYIEVKTTKGDLSQTFYVTRNELVMNLNGAK